MIFCSARAAGSQGSESAADEVRWLSFCGAWVQAALLLIESHNQCIVAQPTAPIRGDKSLRGLVSL
jgi:hypothetical protein